VPPIPSAVCAPARKNGKGGEEPTGTSGKKGKKGGPCETVGPTVVPEPGTWLLVASGLAFVAWQTRRKLARS
jgi:PEP-CTERM motif